MTRWLGFGLTGADAGNYTLASVGTTTADITPAPLAITADDKQKVFDIVTNGNARAIGLDHYGLEKGCNADLVILQARDPVEALRYE